MATSLNAIKDCGTAVDFICGGYTFKLQVLDDVGVNPKEFVKDAYEDLMIAHPYGTKVKSLSGSRPQLGRRSLNPTF